MTKLLTTSALCLVMLGSGQAQGVERWTPAKRHEVCRYNGVSAINWTRWETRKTITCAADQWGVSQATALRIAYRESRFNHAARNPSGACGLFQFLRGWWPSLPGLARLNGVLGAKRCTNARTNALAFAHVAHDSGLGAWGE